MSDRKYRQRGYQDEPRERQPRGPQVPKPQEPRAPRGQTHLAPKTYNMPGFREVMRCARCGNIFTEAIGSLSSCRRCGADLRTCAQCESFDTGQRFECAQAIPVRISPKDVRNSCDLFAPRVTVERETHSQTQAQSGGSPNSARKAFDDLFK
jgi:hypothetical protein